VHTDTVDYADIVLPATTFLEHGDLYKSYGHYYLQMAQAAIPPVGEAMSNLEIFQQLASRMGYTEAIFHEPLESQIQGCLKVDAPALHGAEYRDLLDLKPHRLHVGENPFVDGFPTPSGKLEFFSESLNRLGLDPLPGYEPCLQDGEISGAHSPPLHLLAPPAKHFLNSTFGAVPSLVAKQGRPQLLIHPEEAESRGICDGRTVHVENRHGSCTLYARVTEDAPPGVVVAASVWWQKHSPGGKGINHLTSAKTTDLGQGSTFHCNLVHVTPV